MTIQTLRLVADRPELLDDLSDDPLAGVALAATSRLADRMLKGREDERLLGPEEAAPLVGLSAAYIRKHPRLPFVRRPRGPRGRIKCSLTACRQHPGISTAAKIAERSAPPK